MSVRFRAWNVYKLRSAHDNNNNNVARALMLNKYGFLAFYDFNPAQKINFSKVRNDTKFIVAVYRSAVGKLGPRSGTVPLDLLPEMPNQYIQDSINKSRVKLTHPDGSIEPTTKEQVNDLERAAVWKYDTLMDRLFQENEKNCS